MNANPFTQQFAGPPLASLSPSPSWLPAGLSQLFGVTSLLAMMSSGNYFWDSAKLFILGSIIETGRRFCKWFIERFRFRYSMTARFAEGDPAYDWIILFLTEENVWRRSRDFYVNSKTSARKFGINISSGEQHEEDTTDYVPIYEIPQLFWWKGYWLEIRREQGSPQLSQHQGRNMMYSSSVMYLTIYSLDMTVLKSLVDEAKRRYVEVSKPNVIIHSTDLRNGGPFSWSKVKSKVRRPLSSIILQEGVLESLVEDAQEFIDSEDWYVEAGIPYRRGYLLYGPPGTGKSSTIYALAGELGLEIYSLSLSSDYIDDTLLQTAASLIPKRGILLIEDIDCAFPSREEEEESMEKQLEYHNPMFGMPQPAKRSAVTLSGLLNIIDGVESEEGKFFIATTNYIDRLDPALLRPGRIDKKVQYSLATKQQASSLFTRFFPESRYGKSITETKGPTTEQPIDEKTPLLSESSDPPLDLPALAAQFAEGIPEDDFSVAEIQGHLLSCKTRPLEAAQGVTAWVAAEHAERAARIQREEKRKAKVKEVKDKFAARGGGVGMPAFGGYPSFGGMPGLPPVLPPDFSAPMEATVEAAVEDSKGAKEEELPLVNGNGKKAMVNGNGRDAGASDSE
ncbi:hypothetical protein HGRIS_012068 [Hohenbuehelia grisea]|uniref:P-loop containing nucleoside triphosphate hydrolase protein n=1 Tax=Hohenbuehelia grisea TaxID=104357 RepID=A0ABR3IR58_9AGAR